MGGRGRLGGCCGLLNTSGRTPALLGVCEILPRACGMDFILSFPAFFFSHIKPSALWLELRQPKHTRVVSIRW